jgi:NADP-dependent 3-hydroxy acid dehydrogenase YdfG
MNSLQGKVAIVTRASSGFGRARAKLFAREGARVVIGARCEERLKARVTEIESEGGCAVDVTGDVAEERYAARLVQVALELVDGGVSTVRTSNRSGWLPCRTPRARVRCRPS